MKIVQKDIKMKTTRKKMRHATILGTNTKVSVTKILIFEKTFQIT